MRYVMLQHRFLRYALYFFLISFLPFAASFASAQDTYLDEATWQFLNDSNTLFKQAFADGLAGVSPETAGLYIASLGQLYQGVAGLEFALQDRQNKLQQAGQSVPADLIYLTTAVGSLSAGISALTDYYQSVQYPVGGNAQHQLRFAQLNSTIYWLSLTLYEEKRASY